MNACSGMPRAESRGRYHLEVFGCQMNLADGELLDGILREAGWTRAREPADADLLLLVTCAVRERAVERVLGHIRSLRPLKRRRPDLRIALVGCLARYQGRELSERLPEVDFFLGPDAYRSLPALLAAPPRLPALTLRGGRGETYGDVRPVRGRGVNAWVSVMRGCDRMCAYCVVPFARGRERSLPVDAVLAAAREAIAAGRPSLTLLGQTVTSYRDGETDFAGLLARVSALPGAERIRFLSPHPADFHARLLETIAARPNIARHLHLPVQSGSNRVLAAMRRGYTREQFFALIEAARRAIPELAVTTDLMVGFPGEEERDYEETLDLVRRVGFDGAFMFAYSPRPKTFAARRMEDSVPRAEKIARLERLIALQEEYSRVAHARWIGRAVTVLVEGPARSPAGHWYGRSDDFKDVIFSLPAARETAAGAFADVEVTGATSHTLLGRLRDAR